MDNNTNDRMDGEKKHLERYLPNCQQLSPLSDKIRAEFYFLEK